MLQPSINLLKQKADSRYTLAILAAKRARDLVDGKPRLTDVDIEKPVSVAVHEIAEDLITYRRED
jgi:DNA-directed RNA polymerase subunit omega